MGFGRFREHPLNPKKRTSGKQPANLKGQRFGCLEALCELPMRKNKKVIWWCKCQCCGKEKGISASNLKSGTSSCGCKVSSILRIFSGERLAEGAR